MKVSVAMITCNHAAFIREAIASVLSQKAEFEWELVVGEDNSADSTPGIVAEFARANPQRVRVITSDKRVGMNRNLERTLQSCRGEYIALLEGDDFWTSTAKLQRQVTFLDSHPHLSACFHNAIAFYDDGSRDSWTYTRHDLPPELTTADLLRGNVIPTCAVMYRGRPVDSFPDWLLDTGIGDWPLHLLASLSGNIGFFDETLSSYRVHMGGVFSMRDAAYQHRQILDMYAGIADCLPGFGGLIAEASLDHWYALGVAAARSGDGDTATLAASRYLQARPYTRNLARRLKLGIRTLPFWGVRILGRSVRRPPIGR